MDSASQTNTPDAKILGGEFVSGQKVGGGRYTLIKVLGRGGMGVVWLANDERLQEQVALKFLPSEIRSDASALDDLRRETQKSRKLTHPNIIRIHDFYEAAGEAPFISMEFVDGRNLVTLRIEQSVRVLPWAFLAPLTKQLCDALDYAHGEKLVHRDLKPGNIMLDSRGRVKLADFGIAATMSDSMSRVSLKPNTSGTLPYMSPQQLDGRLPRATDDIYSLGVTLYELLTSRPPFYTGEIAYQVRNLPPDSMEQRLADMELTNEIPPDVAALVMACLAKEPDTRPQSARAVAEWIGLEASPASKLDHLSSDISKSAPRRISVSVREMEVSENPEMTGVKAAKTASPNRKKLLLWSFLVIVFLSGVAAVLMHILDRQSDKFRTLGTEQHVAISSLPSGLAAWWTGDGHARDAVGTNHGIFEGDYASGKIGQAFRLNGSTISIKNRPAWGFGSNDFTIELWVDFAAVPGPCTFVGCDDSDRRWMFCWNQGQLRFHITNDRSSPVQRFLLGKIKTDVGAVNFSPVLGKWHHLAVVRAGNNFTFYIDGVNRGNWGSLLKVPKLEAPLSIGGMKGDFLLKGMVDDVRIYNRALRPDEVKLSTTSVWHPLFDGKTLSSWSSWNRGDWRVESDGSILSEGSVSDLFSPKAYTNFEFRTEIKLSANANGGVLFRANSNKSKSTGYEAQAASSDPLRKTGSLYGFSDVLQDLVAEDAWFNQHLIAIGNRIVIKIDEQIVVDYQDTNYTHQSGRFALRQQAPGKVIMYRNVMAKSLPADESAAWAEAKKDMPDLK